MEKKFRIPHVQHVPIEPHIAVAQVEPDGDVTVWASSQSPFSQRSSFAKALGVSESKIRVIAGYVGGGFGCKAGVTMENVAVALASKAGGRPVKVRLTREEEFFTNFVRQGLIINLKIGCDAQGNVLAMENTQYWDGGASTEYGVNITRAGGYNSSGPFDIPNVKTDAMCVYTNHPIGGAYRGFGMSELHAGIIQTMDMLAEKIGMDKVEFLKRNAIQGGDFNVTGMKMHPVGLQECIDRVAKELKWGEKRKPAHPPRNAAKGLALYGKLPPCPRMPAPALKSA